VSEYEILITAAKQARENAHAPFSNFRVGAALRATSGRIFGGCNVETPPCGACRQLIWEFCGNVPVVLANLKGKIEIIQMRELFPKPFDSSNL
jgi:cytidine deaminase